MRGGGARVAENQKAVHASMFRSPILAAVLALLLAMPSAAEDAAATARALEAARKGDWPVAMGQARLSGTLALDVIEWQKLRAGEGTFAEFAGFAARRADWPGMPLLLRKGEAAIRPGEDPAQVVGYFRAQKPQTGAGSLALIDALAARGEFAGAEAEAVRAWRELSLTAEEQATLAGRFPNLLADHHGGRMAAMLRAGKLDDARRMLPLVSDGTRAVAQARIGLQAQADGVDALIAAVPERMLGSAGLAHDRFIWRIRKDRYDEAADLLLERSASAESLGEPARWADWRRTLARREMRLGDPARAYRMAARHHLSEGSDYADLEWLAGYIALRKLGDAQTALAHFQRFAKAVNGPISLGRAGYWEGRALEALARQEEARSAYARAARHQTAFYGQLAAERIGQPLDPALAGTESYPDWRGAGFTGSGVFQAAVLLQAAGDADLAKRFLLHLAEGLGGEEIAALAGMALEWREPHLALMLAKAAADKGRILPRAYFPLTGLEKLTMPVPAELALSIARRESEFDHRVVSSAGARGLMQVMPGTAKLMAGRLGLSYEDRRLTSDWEYNARLGTAYLAQLIEEFGPTAVLVAAGYNAGPGRPRRWVEELGDPRHADTDIVDWIEHIPFRETQNYVMRVAESLPIYRARLAGQAGALRLTEELRGR